MATETAGKPAAPRSKAGAAKGARALGSVASAAREKLSVRERQTAMLVGQIAAQLEDKQPGRIFAVKLTCTRYKSTGMIVFNQRRARAPMNERDADDDSALPKKTANSLPNCLQSVYCLPNCFRERVLSAKLFSRACTVCQTVFETDI